MEFHVWETVDEHPFGVKDPIRALPGGLPPPPSAAVRAPARPVCEHAFVHGEATILHADLDSFYASVEQRDDPSLRGRPVLVGSGVVLAASYEAKARGVRTPMNCRQALRLCPDAVVVDPRMSAYSEASRAVFEVFEDATPLVEGLSVDEAFLEVGGLRRIAGTPEEIGHRLRRDAAERVGLPITVGVARTAGAVMRPARKAPPTSAPSAVAAANAASTGPQLVALDSTLALLPPLPLPSTSAAARFTIGPSISRMSSLIALSCIGTLKSTRTKAVLPSGASSMRRKVMCSTLTNKTPSSWPTGGRPGSRGS